MSLLQLSEQSRLVREAAKGWSMGRVTFDNYRRLRRTTLAAMLRIDPDEEDRPAGLDEAVEEKAQEAVERETREVTGRGTREAAAVEVEEAEEEGTPSEPRKNRRPVRLLVVVLVSGLAIWLVMTRLLAD